MSVFGVFRRINLAGLVLYGAVSELFSSPADSSRGPAPLQKQPGVLRTAAATAITGVVLTLIGGLALMFSGFYNIAADRPHFAPVRWALKTGSTRSVKFHSSGIQAPNLRDRSLLKNGLALYRKNCQPCHGAPGVPADQIGRGINPKPPQLITRSADWTDSELYWIISHGLKMSGMPGFAPRLSDRDRWATVAFLRHLNRLSPADYRELTAAMDKGLEPAAWGVDDSGGFAQVRAVDTSAGPGLLFRYGCPACHTIPAVGHGQVGPALTDFAEREYIAGFLVNVPANTINWIMDPAKYKPNTAMPKLGVKRDEAADIAAYLYTLGNPKRIKTFQ